MFLQKSHFVKVSLLVTAVILSAVTFIYVAQSQGENQTYLPALFTNHTGPQIFVTPACGNGTDVNITVIGVSWDEDESITLFWDNELQTTIPANEHNGDFVQTWSFTEQTNGTHEVRAVSDGVGDETDSTVVTYRIPCPPPTMTPYATLTPSVTPSVTPSPTSTTQARCDIRIVGDIHYYQDFVDVTGDIGTTAQLFNLNYPSNPILLGTVELVAEEGHACPGFATFSDLNHTFHGNDLVGVTSSDGSSHTVRVLHEPTATATWTATPTLTPTPDATSTIPPTHTSTPMATLTPSVTPSTTPTPQPCDVQIEGSVHYYQNFVNITGDIGTTAELFNLTVNPSLPLGSEELLAAEEHACPGAAVFRGLDNQLHEGDQLAVFSSDGSMDTIIVLGEPTMTPTWTVTPISTPSLPDLLIVGPPRIVSTPPIVGYEPVQFSLTISNDGDLDVDHQFFVDVFIDPTVVFSYGIPITQSYGYAAVSNLPGKTSQVITITAPLGFPNPPNNSHVVYGMVDSVAQVGEGNELNNVSTPLPIAQGTTTPAGTVTLTPTPGGENIISGGAFIFQEGLQAQYRAFIRVIDDSTGQTIATTLSDALGSYEFNNLPTPTSAYTVSACINIDGNDWYGTALGIVPPNSAAHIIMFEQPCP